MLIHYVDLFTTFPQVLDKLIAKKHNNKQNGTTRWSASGGKYFNFLILKGQFTLSALFLIPQSELLTILISWLFFGWTIPLNVFVF